MTEAGPPRGTPATLVLEGVAITLNGAVLVPVLSRTVRAGEVLTIMGPSGSGKSTLLAFVSGTLDRAFTARGQVSVWGEPVTHLPPERRRIGILYQDDLLFPHLSVGQNLAFGLAPTVKGRAVRRQRIDRALEDAGLAGFHDRDPATLSGGQRARAALMRMLLSEPRAVLLDEPFSKLDAALRDRFRRFVFDHLRDAGLPALMVTHDPADAEAAGGPVLVIDPDGGVSGAAERAQVTPFGGDAGICLDKQGLAR